MDKLTICRICLAENVRMHVVVNSNLHELYERLTDIPFVTEDNRPILACFFCCAKLKQCYRFLRQCLEAEELFAQMMNKDYEPSSLINHNHLQFFNGFIKSPIEHISILDECQTEIIAIKEEFPPLCEALDVIIEPKEEHQIDEIEPESFDNSSQDVADIPPYHSESDLEDDVPLMKFKIEVEEEQEVSKEKRRARETKKSFTYLSRSSFPIDILEFNGVNSDNFISESQLVTSVSLQETNDLSPNVPATEVLDISHNHVIEPFIPAIECPTSQSLNHNDEQTNDNPMLMTPPNQQKKKKKSSPSVSYVNDLEAILSNIETQNSSPGIIPTEPEKRIMAPTEILTRKRKRNRDLWKDRKNKALKNSGQSYESVRTNKKNPEKSIGPPCNCKLKCYEKINEDMRKNIFKKFWDIGDHERQWDFINCYVQTEHVKKIKEERKHNRTRTLIYQLPDDTNLNIKICKTMFLNSLSVTQQVVYTAIKKLEGNNNMKDNRGNHKNRPRKMSEETEKSITDHINRFERVEAPYVRKDSQKEYLCETLNISKMHRLYLEWMDTNTQYNITCKATKRQYEVIFNTKFNISFHKPKLK